MRGFAVAVGLMLGIVGLGSHYVGVLLKPPVPPTPVAPEVNPSGVLAGVSRADAAVLREFYAAMADIVVRDGKAENPVSKTVFDLRARHKNALSMAFVATALVGKYPGLGDRLDQYLLQAVGNKDLPLTPDLRAAAAKAFLAI